jgi:hypothetical protein
VQLANETGGHGHGPYLDAIADNRLADLNTIANDCSVPDVCALNQALRPDFAVAPNDRVLGSVSNEQSRATLL